MEIGRIEAETKKNLTGFSLDQAKTSVSNKCRGWTPLSTDLCVEYVMNAFAVDSAAIDDQERGRRLSKLFGTHDLAT